MLISYFIKLYLNNNTQGMYFANNYKQIEPYDTAKTSAGLLEVDLSDAEYPQAPIAIENTKVPVKMILRNLGQLPSPVIDVDIDPMKLMESKEFFR
jgi:hypothetical protein